MILTENGCAHKPYAHPTLMLSSAKMQLWEYFPDNYHHSDGQTQMNINGSAIPRQSAAIKAMKKSTSLKSLMEFLKASKALDHYWSHWPMTAHAGHGLIAVSLGWLPLLQLQACKSLGCAGRAGWRSEHGQFERKAIGRGQEIQRWLSALSYQPLQFGTA